ncbi:MAG: winged helix-turn-helix transcriptional regulator, partial [Sphingomonadales bacterium]|nr:winged helix-turn-helix transcriptional regulator [Sphingomonadales bacterium]
DSIRTVGPRSTATCLAQVVPSEHALRKAAAKLAAARKQRSDVLPGDMFGEPAWDILLELFSRALPQSMKSICIGAGVPLTSTLRWVGLLDQQGLLTQYPDPNDARRTLVRLTAQGQDKVAEAVSGIRAAMVDTVQEI